MSMWFVEADVTLLYCEQLSEPSPGLDAKMGKCIFCKSASGGFNTREHILPESLGGDEWALLAEGLMCDRCQNRFGSHVEQQALADYPFSFLRVFLGVPTKKGKAPWFDTWEGTVRASPGIGTFGYDPALHFEAAVEEGRKTQLRLLAQPSKPSFVCRFLLKMGLEVMANDSLADVFADRFDAARSYALDGIKDGSWWYLQREDMEAASSFIRQGVTRLDWQTDVEMRVVTIEDEAEIFHLRLFYLDMMVPLEPRIQLGSMADLKELEYRCFSV